MADEIVPAEELDQVEVDIDAWLRIQLAENPVVAAVERGEPGERRWYVRVTGEQKAVFTIWFTLGQRTPAVRDLRDAGARGEPGRALRAPAAPQPQAQRRRLRHRRRGRGVPRRPGAGAARSTRASSIASSARSTPTPSSASGPPCASATPASSRADQRRNGSRPRAKSPRTGATRPLASPRSHEERGCACCERGLGPFRGQIESLDPVSAARASRPRTRAFARRSRSRSCLP